MFLRFAANARGNVAITFALSLLPILGSVGAAIDYTRSTSVRASLQIATDRTVLLAAREPKSAALADIQTRAKAQFDANYHPGKGVKVTTFAVNRVGDEMTVEATASVDMSLTRLIGFEAASVGAVSYAQRGAKKVEVVMALDNTGSMANNSKLTELKRAAGSLLDVLEKSSSDTSQVKAGLVPFATSVRLKPMDYRNAAWIDFTSGDGSDTVCQGSGKRKTCTDHSANDINKTTWLGCVQDRADPSNTRDDPVVVGNYATMHPAITCRQSEDQLVFVQPLTTNFSSLRTAINDMKAGGNTNVTIGVAWGQTLLSNQAPFTEGAPYADPDVSKFLIVLTDGQNTQDRFASCSTSTCIAQMNARTKAACDAVKATASQPGQSGVTVYTVRVIDGDADLLRNCASSPDKYFDVQNSSQLEKVFIDIGNKISALRLTQ